MTADLFFHRRRQIERLYLNKTASDAEKADYIRRLDAEHEAAIDKIKRDNALEAKRQNTENRASEKKMQQLESELSATRRKFALLESDKVRPLPLHPPC